MNLIHNLPPPEKSISALAMCQQELRAVIYRIAQFLLGQLWKEK